jgi:preprotein translocase subunit YajC
MTGLGAQGASLNQPMEPLVVLAVTFLLLWVIFIRPQQRRVRAHQALVASVQPGDQVVLSAGIFGRIIETGPEEITLEVAPGVVLRVARQAVLRVVEDATADPAEDGTSTGPPPESDVPDRDDGPDESGRGSI